MPRLNTDFLIASLYLIPVFLFSISFHEFSHALMSYRMGDPTAKNQGRLTLNPFKHIDLLGAIMFLVMRIGWAKPVPINTMYYKNRKRGIFLTSLAGPMSNFFIALMFAFLMVFTGKKLGLNPANLISIDFSLFRGSELPVILHNLSKLFYSANLMLAAFNLLPISPLDGSRILSVLIPSRHYYKIMKYDNYIMIAFLIIIFLFPQVISAIISPLLWLFRTIIAFIVKLTFS
ncbi:MAG: site-2 protease family protein [Eubacteriales bacterium]|nr:site-2 protease family protein [Eubacteriales bacterium]